MNNKMLSLCNFAKLTVNMEAIKMPTLEITVEQIAEVVERFSDEGVENLETLLLASELEKRSREVKKEGYLKLEQISSLQNV